MSKYLIENIEILEAPEAVLSTMTKDGKRKWMYPVATKGSFYYKRLLVGWGLIVLFVALPLININGNPAVFLDIMHWKFYFFGMTLYPTDTFLFLLFIVGSILSIVLGTALLGRIWCGWGCPQTVYLDFVFRPIERFIEGKELLRKKRNEGEWNWDKIWRKSLKFFIFALISFALAHVFIAYFVGWKDLAHWMFVAPTENLGFFFLMLLVTALMLFDFGYFREQMCLVTCPYARMQSVLLDKDSLIVSYNPERGEPRGHQKKNKDNSQLGDCIDCYACVRTCPTGIDIREGLQMECIACTQCIDACDVIMEKMDKPKGLISYTSENRLAGIRQQILRPRVLVYMALLAGIWGFLGFSIWNRATYDVNVGRTVGAPFVVLQDGNIANRIRFRVRNQKDKPVSFTIKALAPKDTRVQIIGLNETKLNPGEMKRVETFIITSPQAFQHQDKVEALFRLSFSDNNVVEKPFTLLGPVE